MEKFIIFYATSIYYDSVVVDAESLDDARAYARRLSNTQNVISVTFYKQMY